MTLWFCPYSQLQIGRLSQSILRGQYIKNLLKQDLSCNYRKSYCNWLGRSPFPPNNWAETVVGTCTFPHSIGPFVTVAACRNVFERQTNNHFSRSLIAAQCGHFCCKIECTWLGTRLFQLFHSLGSSLQGILTASYGWQTLHRACWYPYRMQW